ncbi:MAG: hypothetical protein M3081_14735 [Gemmatimonadota bacterium]|nr:hypothetical protein [Gemmatimonadota bacterium]
MPVRRLALVVVACAAAASCRPKVATPARSQFLLAAGDSTFWVTTGENGIRVRGSPLQLARYGGRFYEIYLADDDRSYPDATIIGQRIYRRDLITNDSLLVFEDSIIAGFARRFADSHPDEQPLGPNDDPPEDPSLSATSEIVLVGEHGPFLSFEYRADATFADSEAAGFHSMARGVIDLRSGKRASLTELFGAKERKRLLARGAALFGQAMDSVRSSRDARAREAAETLADFAFDSSSFAIVADRRVPTIEFLSPGHGERVGGFALTLSAISVTIVPPWWAEVTEALADSETARGEALWHHGRLQLVAHDEPDASGSSIVLVDSALRRWPAGRVSAPVWRVYWLDGSSIDSVALGALSRAFDDAALYSDDTRTASCSGCGRYHRHGPGDIRLAARRASRLVRPSRRAKRT